jgi:hypothetical protein
VGDNSHYLPHNRWLIRSIVRSVRLTLICIGVTLVPIDPENEFRMTADTI